jgi:hypothetical protein
MTKRALLPLLLLLVMCTERAAPPQSSSPAPPPPAPSVAAPVRTDRTRYVLRPGPYGPETTIVTTFRAPADRPAYLVNCNGALSLGLQRLENGQWMNAWIAEINGCMSAPIVVAAGATHTATMTPVSRPESWTITGGTYRAVWHNVVTSFDPRAGTVGEDLPLEQRVSAPFTIEAIARP